MQNLDVPGGCFPKTSGRVSDDNSGGNGEEHQWE